jgi:hypothetical protein
MTAVTLGKAEDLRTLLSDCLPADSRAWFEESRRLFEAGPASPEWFVRFAEVSGRLGAEPLATARVRAGRQQGDFPPGIDAWRLDECGRVVLLAQAAAHLPPDRVADLADSCYFQGETRERQGVVRSLWYLPRTDRLLQIGLDAGRSHVQPLFEAVACENAFPADAFPDLAFNHLVLKSLFSDVRLDRIVGLSGRVTGELRQMVRDFVDERRAAGRPVPADATSILS